MSCCDCTVFACMKGGGLPEDCTTKLCAADARDHVLDLYLNTDMRSIMQTATVVALKGTEEKWPRIREVIEFAHATGVKRIGIGSCATYIKEIPLLADILRAEGFEVVGAMCKMATIRKTDVEIVDETVKDSVVICNPVMQAQALNNSKTDMNVVVGLCVGHDMLFTKHSEALCTTLEVRDRSKGSAKPFHEVLERYREECNL